MFAGATIMDLLESYITSLSPSNMTAKAVSDYFEWQRERNSAEFIPSDDDDVDLRTYLYHLRANGVDRDALEEKVAALRQFYKWLQIEGMNTSNPFDEYKFDLPFISTKEIDSRLIFLPTDKNEQEVDKLIALSQIAEVLNKSVDIQDALNNTLSTTLKVMNLKTGWVSMLAESHLSILRGVDSPPHGFVLATTCGLPHSLQQDDCSILRQPPACRCQNLLEEGRLNRAINIVECSRLRDSGRTATENQNLRFHASVPLISHGKPLGLINVASAEWQFLTNADLHFLTTISAQLVIALERAHFYEVAEMQRIRLENELQIARKVQVGLMPSTMPEIPGFNLACAWHPESEVSGDFYDVFPLDEGCWGLVIGDVVGKGAAAALYMAMIHSLILSGALRDQSPAAVLMDVNETILRQSPSGIFVTIFLAVLDPKNQTIQYANAGHNPPIVRRANNTFEELTKTGVSIGMIGGLEWSEATIKLDDGDALILYTDGVTEANNPYGEFYDDSRLFAAIKEAPRQAGELLDHLETDLNSFVQGAIQKDDVTFLVLTKD